MTDVTMASRFAEFEDFEAHARDTLAKAIFEHLNAGAGRNWTRDENRRAYDRWLLRKRLLVDVSDVDLSTTVAGRELAFPLMLAPSAFHKLIHPDGEIASAKAARAVGAGMVLSTLSSTPLEEVAEVGLPMWMQLQIHHDKGLTSSLVQRAEAAGFTGICLSVDAPTIGLRPADKRNQIHLPTGVTIANLEDRMDLPERTTGEDLMAYMWKEMAYDVTWQDAEWLVNQTSLPIMAKGIMTAGDARRAVDAGCRLVVVSNQGGRMVDGEPATLDVLSEVVSAVGSEAEVLVDGGIRQGVHILKALALGARCVLVGRPTYWGLAAGGEPGVQLMLQNFRDGLLNAMQLCGVTSVRDVPRDLVSPARSLATP